MSNLQKIAKKKADEPAPLPMDNHPTQDEMLRVAEELKYFLATAPTNWTPGEEIKRFKLPNGDYVSCVLWNNLFHITGTDVLRSIVFRFAAYGRPVTNMKKFEEGVFSDLRNLKPGVDASLEGPRSGFLDLLYQSNCIRTKKKQKVFYWYSVPHDRLFMDALERDLKREALGIEATTVATPYQCIPPHITEAVMKSLMAGTGAGARIEEAHALEWGGRFDPAALPPLHTLPDDASHALSFASPALMFAPPVSHSVAPGLGMSSLHLGAPGLPGLTVGPASAPVVGAYGLHLPSLSPAVNGLSAPYSPAFSDYQTYGDAALSPNIHASINNMHIFSPVQAGRKGEFLLPPGVAGNTGAKADDPSSHLLMLPFLDPALDAPLMSPTDGESPKKKGRPRINKEKDGKDRGSKPVSPLGGFDAATAFVDPMVQAFSQALGSPTGLNLHPADIRVEIITEGDHKVKVFPCSFDNCGRRFRRFEHLRRHLRCHSGERPYACNECGKMFSRSDNLQQHMKVHFEARLVEKQGRRKGKSAGGSPMGGSPARSPGRLPADGEALDDYLQDAQDLLESPAMLPLEEPLTAFSDEQAEHYQKTPGLGDDGLSTTDFSVYDQKGGFVTSLDDGFLYGV